MSDEPAPPPAAPPPPATGPSNGHGAPATPVPYERFASVVSARDVAVEAHKVAAGRIQALERQLSEATAAAKSRETAWGEERDLIRHGFDDVASQAAARAAFGALPDDGRPPSIGDYIAGFKAEGAEVPRWAAPYIAPPAAPAASPGRPAPPAPRPTAPTAIGSVSGEALRVLREQAEASGDWTAWRAATGITI